MKLPILCRWTFSTSSIINRGVALDSTYMFGAKNTGNSKADIPSKLNL